ncbi:MAG: hypothetical protein HGA98_02960 [Deltaproteobacteria bacterium]|nr:hypothetical protein [Deltaproteobacteria bacterium]
MTAGRRLAAIGVGLLWLVGATLAGAADRAPHKKSVRHRAKPAVKGETTSRRAAERPAKKGVRRAPRRCEERSHAKAEDRPVAKPDDRVPAGAAEPTVAFTVLPGDTHARLASDLTGANGHEEALRRIDPTLKPGETIRVPSNLLLPGLADARRETVVFGGEYPTLWSVARRTQTGSLADVGRTARNLQRLNAILVADRLAPGTKILVPKSWLEVGGARPEPTARRQAEPEPEELGFVAPEAPPDLSADEVEAAAEGSPAERPDALEAALPELAAPHLRAVPAPPLLGATPFAIQKQYLVRDLAGLSRANARIPSRLRQLVSDREYEKAHEGRGEIDLVVIHTTEHRGSTFENTASYIRRKRLANYVVGPDGAVYEVVPEEYRAYGCGDSVWDGRYYVDFEAINVEVFANTDKGPHQGAISDAQYEGIAALVADIRARRPKIDESRVVTHRMVALNVKTGTRSRKGDPFEFDWWKAGLPDNSQVADRDLLDGRAKICTDFRFTDRITTGQTEALKELANKM